MAGDKSRKASKSLKKVYSINDGLSIHTYIFKPGYIICLLISFFIGNWITWNLLRQTDKCFYFNSFFSVKQLTFEKYSSSRFRRKPEARIGRSTPTIELQGKTVYQKNTSYLKRLWYMVISSHWPVRTMCSSESIINVYITWKYLS